MLKLSLQSQFEINSRFGVIVVYQIILSGAFTKFKYLYSNYFEFKGKACRAIVGVGLEEEAIIFKHCYSLEWDCKKINKNILMSVSSGLLENK